MAVKVSRFQIFGILIVLVMFAALLTPIPCPLSSTNCRANLKKFVAISFSNPEKEAENSALKQDFRLKAFLPPYYVCLSRQDKTGQEPCYRDWIVSAFDCKELPDSAIGEDWYGSDFSVDGIDLVDNAKDKYFSRYNRKILSYSQNPYSKNCKLR